MSYFFEQTSFENSFRFLDINIDFLKIYFYNLFEKEEYKTIFFFFSVWFGISNNFDECIFLEKRCFHEIKLNQEMHIARKSNFSNRFYAASLRHVEMRCFVLKKMGRR